jgi:hypothetical protein
MAAGGVQRRRDYGARIVSGAALLGAVVSVYNYFAPSSGISDTPGALLVVITSVLVFVLGFAIGALRPGGGLRRFASGLCLVLILGTGFAAYLLESPTLLAAMVVCWLGWSVQLLGPRRAVA